MLLLCEYLGFILLVIILSARWYWMSNYCFGLNTSPPCTWMEGFRTLIHTPTASDIQNLCINKCILSRHTNLLVCLGDIIIFFTLNKSQITNYVKQARKRKRKTLIKNIDRERMLHIAYRVAKVKVDRTHAYSGNQIGHVHAHNRHRMIMHRRGRSQCRGMQTKLACTVGNVLLLLTQWDGPVCMGIHYCLWGKRCN